VRFIGVNIKNILCRNSKSEKIPIRIPIWNGQLLKDRSALITGGTSGIGFAIAKVFVAQGADVIITGRDEEKLKRASKEIGNGIRGVILDNEDVDSIGERFLRLSEDYTEKKIDILVNNAGVNSFSKFLKVSAEEWDKVVNINLRGTYFFAQVFSDYMIKNHIKGNILNIGSSSGYNPAIKPYGITKWGIHGLTKGLAKALLPYDIIVNGIAPGPTATDMLDSSSKGESIDIGNERYPARRFIMPEEIANLAVFLTSDMGRMIVGDMIPMTGGCGVLSYDYLNYDVM